MIGGDDYHRLSKRAKRRVARLMNRRRVNGDAAINTIRVSCCNSHGCSGTHTMAHNSKLVKTVAVCKSDHVIGHKLIIMVVVVVGSRMISHLNEVRVSL
jgi:hypothetical protein